MASPHLLGFVKYPPEEWSEEDSPSLLISELALPIGPMSVHLAGNARRLKKNDPIRILQTFYLADQLNVFPPEILLRWLAKGIETFFASNGEKPLEVCLGLRNPKGGRGANAFRDYLRERYLDSLMLELHRLRRVFKLTIEEAAEMVHALTAHRSRRHPAGWVVPSYEAGTLRDYYRKAPGRVYREADRQVGASRLWRFTDAEKWQILARFPFAIWEDNPRLQRFARWAKAHATKAELRDPDKLSARPYLVR